MSGCLCPLVARGRCSTRWPRAGLPPRGFVLWSGVRSGGERGPRVILKLALLPRSLGSRPPTDGPMERVPGAPGGMQIPRWASASLTLSQDVEAQAGRAEPRGTCLLPHITDRKTEALREVGHFNGLPTEEALQPLSISRPLSQRPRQQGVPGVRRAR